MIYCLRKAPLGNENFMLRSKRIPNPKNVTIFSENLKRPKNGQDSSVFDDFHTELTATTRSIISKILFFPWGASSPRNFHFHGEFRLISTASDQVSGILLIADSTEQQIIRFVCRNFPKIPPKCSAEKTYVKN